MAFSSYFTATTEDSISRLSKEGKVFRLYYDKVIPSGGKTFLLVQIPDVILTLFTRQLAATTGPISFTVYANPSVVTSPSLTEIPSFNLSGISNKIPEAKTYEIDESDVVDLGTEVDKDLVLASQDVPNRSLGSRSEQALYRIFPQNSEYLIEIDNAGNSKASNILLFYVWTEDKE